MCATFSYHPKLRSNIGVTNYCSFDKCVSDKGSGNIYLYIKKAIFNSLRIGIYLSRPRGHLVFNRLGGLSRMDSA